MKKFIALLLLTVLPCSQLLAWGFKGHRIVGDIARDHLAANARHNLITLLGNDDLAAISTWADEVRSERPDSYGWHFVDIPKGAAGFSEERDCYRPDDKHPASKEDHHNCVVDRILIFKQILANKNASQPDRVEALKWVVHFVGDIHQPMHAIGEARGGNDVHISEFGSTQCGNRPCNLHAEWDSGLIEHTGRSEQEYVAYLEQMIAAKKLQASGNPEDWANESLRLAKQVWVSDGGAIDDAYYKTNIGIVDERLALAGLRLAAVLNDALGEIAVGGFLRDNRAAPGQNACVFGQLMPSHGIIRLTPSRQANPNHAPPSSGARQPIILPRSAKKMITQQKPSPANIDASLLGLLTRSHRHKIVIMSDIELMRNHQYAMQLYGRASISRRHQTIPDPKNIISQNTNSRALADRASLTRKTPKAIKKMRSLSNKRSTADGLSGCGFTT